MITQPFLLLCREISFWDNILDILKDMRQVFNPAFALISINTSKLSKSPRGLKSKTTINVHPLLPQKRQERDLVEELRIQVVCEVLSPKDDRKRNSGHLNCFIRAKCSRIGIMIMKGGAIHARQEL